MFEKEAEEYVRKIRHDVINWGGKEPEERFYNEIKFKQAYLAGAEFGYNKANEWHYVKDGDLPKIGEKVLSEKGDLVIYKGDGFNWVEYSPNADNIKLRKWEEPRAWKEITPPKEI